MLQSSTIEKTTSSAKATQHVTSVQQSGNSSSQQSDQSVNAEQGVPKYVQTLTEASSRSDIGMETTAEAASSADSQAEAAANDVSKAAQKPKQNKQQALAQDNAQAEATAEQPLAPVSPEQDPQFKAFKRSSKKAAKKQKKHAPASRKANEAQAAAKGPTNEVENAAKGQQLAKMDAQQPKPFDRQAFIDALKTRILQITPKTLEQADEFKSDGKAKAIKGEVMGQVKQSKQASQQAIQQSSEEKPDASGLQAKQVEKLPAKQMGLPPQNLRASRAAPKKKSSSEVSLQKNSDSLDQYMTDADMTEQQLTESNEPEFIATVDAKKQTQQHAEEAPVVYREEEQGLLMGARSEASLSAQKDALQMHSQRGEQLSLVENQQQLTKSENELKRQQVSNKIQAFYEATKSKVETGLKDLDEKVNSRFDTGAETARVEFENYVADRMRKYKKTRYRGIRGKARWLKDKIFDLPSYVNKFYVEGRKRYVAAMDKLINTIATQVENGLNKVKKDIAEGRRQVKEYVDNLPKDVQKLGEQAADNIASEFDVLESKVDDKQTQLIDNLAKKYVDNLNKVDERIKAMKEANKGLLSKAKDMAVGVYKTIQKLKNMLLGVLARAVSVIGQIIKAPIKFLGNLVKGVGQGLKNFSSNIVSHLQKGLMGWLFGALEGAGITLPASFDLKGIISLVLQVLGLTYANFRARAVKLLGEPMVGHLEQAAEIFRIVMQEGAIGLWQWVKEKLTAIKESVWDGIMSFVKERIIMAGITWIIGLLNPAAAFIKACKMIYDIVMFFVNRGKQIIALVNAVLNSIAAIAKGATAVAAAAVENALSKALPVAISFLASLLGLGGISQKIRAIIQRVQRPVNKIIDWVIKKAVSLLKAVGGLFGKNKSVQGETHSRDPEQDAKVSKGLFALDEMEKQYLKDGKISKKDAQKVAASIKKKHPVFKSIDVVSGADSWDYEYVASPKKKKKGEKKSVVRDGSKESPYFITWFKRPLKNYVPLYLHNDKVNKRMSRSSLEKAKDEGKAKEYKPTQRKTLSNGETIGVTSENQVKKGMLVGPSSSGRNDAEKSRFNRLLESYGYDRSEEPTDGDHVVELQVSGKDNFVNLWPLNSSENRSSGSRLSRHKTTTEEGKEVKIKELKNKYFEIKDFDY